MVPKRIYILVVDDLADMAYSTADLLTLWGYDATACTSGAMALECARARPPAAVLLDLAMPRMDGFEFARAFRALDACNDVPLIALSGYAYPADAGRATIDYYLLKPVNPDRLKGLLASSIRLAITHARRPGTRWKSRVRGRDLLSCPYSNLCHHRRRQSQSGSFGGITLLAGG